MMAEEARMLLLPDEAGTPKATVDSGMVSLLGEEDPLTMVGKAMKAEASAHGTMIASSVLSDAEPERLAAWRGTLAVALLADTWKADAGLRVLTLTPGSSDFARLALEAAHQSKLSLAVLGYGESARILGVLNPETILTLPAAREELSAALPDVVNWYDPEKRCFLDPCAALNHRDRLTLAARLEAFDVQGEVAAFAKALRDTDDALHESCLRGDQQAHWIACMKAVIGLSPELTEAPVVVRQLLYRETPMTNPLMDFFGVAEPEDLPRGQQLDYLWRGVLFARSDAVIGLEPSADLPSTHLAEECARMERYSRRYDHDLSERFGAYLLSRDAVFCQDARDQVLAWQKDARAAAASQPEALALEWPWVQHSPSVTMLLKEALGEQMAPAALAPFSDRLCLMPGAILGDAVAQVRCGLYADGELLTAIPPIGDSLAEYTARYGWTGRGIHADGITLEMDGTGILVRLVLKGNSEVIVSRHYGEEDTWLLSHEQAPQLSLWPSVPIEHGRWCLYYISVRGNVGIRFLRNDTWTEEACDLPLLPETDAESTEEAPAFTTPVPRVSRTDELPSCVSLWSAGLCLGALMYQAAIWHPEEKGAAVAALDLGASGTALALGFEQQAQPVSIPCLWHVLLRAPWYTPDGEALPVQAISPVVPSAVRLLTEGEDTEPLLDGCICFDALPAETPPVIYDLLWRTDPEAERARTLLLRESMLLCAFHAVMCGAQSISWRITLPSGMARDGQLRRLDDVRHAADWLSSVSGLRQTPGLEPVSLRKSFCAGQYLREQVVHGPFLMLDLGASSTEIALWLRGMQRPALECCTATGVSAPLLEAWLQDPSLLQKDFAALSLPEEQLRCDGMAGHAAWSRRRLLLDHLLTPDGPVLPWLNACYRQAAMNLSQSLLLLGWAEAMLLGGLSLQQVRENASLNDYLPMELTVCLCGRGSSLLSRLDPTLRQGVISFIRLGMSTDHPVRALRMTDSVCPKLEPVLGLCRMRNLPEKGSAPGQSFSRDERSFLPTVVRFLNQFTMLWPQAAQLLFPGMLGTDGSYTPAAQQIITEACRQEGAPQDRLHACLLEIHTLLRGLAMQASQEDTPDA